MTDKHIRIRHADGREYDVSGATFRATYEAEGFVPFANADGTALETPKPKREKGVREEPPAKRAAATRAARRAAKQAAAAQALGSGDEA